MKKVIRILLVAFIVFVAVNIAISTFALKTTRFTVNSWSLPSAFEGFRIAQISDLHNMSFGKDNISSLRQIAEDLQEPVSSLFY